MKAFFKKIKKIVVGHKLVTLLVAVVMVAAIVAGCFLPTLLSFSNNNSKLTRGVWIELLRSNFGFTEYQTEEPFYADIQKENELFASAQALKERDIIKYGENLDVEKNVTFGEMLLHISNVYGVDYIQRRLEIENAAESDLKGFVRAQTGLSTSFKDDDVLNVEQATAWVTDVREKYIEREFGNSFSVDWNENVKEFTDVTEYSVENDTLFLTSEKEIAVNDILVLGKKEDNNPSAAYKVNSIVSHTGQDYILTVSTPAAEEVFDEFQYEFSKVLDVGDFIPAEGITVIGKDEASGNQAEGELLVNVDSSLFGNNANVVPLSTVNMRAPAIQQLNNFSAGKTGVFFDKSVKVSDKLILNPDFPGTKATNYNDSVADGIFLDENGNKKNKFDGGFELECGLKLSNFKVSGSLNWRVLILASDFTVNSSMDVTPYFKLKGNAAKTINLGRIPNCNLSYGFMVDIDINAVISINGDISIEPTIHCTNTITKDKGSYTPRGTGNATTDTEVSINGDANFSIGPDITLSWLDIIDFADVYAYMGVGVSSSYTTSKPNVITASLYLPTLHIGVGENEDTLLSVLRKGFFMDTNVDLAIIDNNGGIYRCPYTLTKEFSVMKTKPMTWDFKDGVLTVSGVGKIPDYIGKNAGETLPPWYRETQTDNDILDDVNVAIKKVVIEDGITYIGAGAFATLSGLEEVVMADSVVEIGEGAFSDCEILKSVKFSTGLDKIGYDAFGYCPQLEGITLPSSLRLILKGAFQYCESLTSITIPENVEAVDRFAFEGCSSLASVIIKSKDTFVAESAFNHTAYYPGEKDDTIAPIYD